MRPLSHHELLDSPDPELRDGPEFEDASSEESGFGGEPGFSYELREGELYPHRLDGALESTAPLREVLAADALKQYDRLLDGLSRGEGGEIMTRAPELDTDTQTAYHRSSFYLSVEGEIVCQEEFVYEEERVPEEPEEDNPDRVDIGTSAVEGGELSEQLPAVRPQLPRPAETPVAAEPTTSRFNLLPNMLKPNIPDNPPAGVGSETAIITEDVPKVAHEMVAAREVVVETEAVETEVAAVATADERLLPPPLPARRALRLHEPPVPTVPRSTARLVIPTAASAETMREPDSVAEPELTSSPEPPPALPAVRPGSLPTETLPAEAAPTEVTPTQLPVPEAIQPKSVVEAIGVSNPIPPEQLEQPAPSAQESGGYQELRPATLTTIARETAGSTETVAIAKAEVIAETIETTGVRATAETIAAAEPAAEDEVAMTPTATERSLQPLVAEQAEPDAEEVVVAKAARRPEPTTASAETTLPRIEMAATLQDHQPEGAAPAHRSNRLMSPEESVGRDGSAGSDHSSDGLVIEFRQPTGQQRRPSRRLAIQRAAGRVA